MNFLTASIILSAHAHLILLSDSVSSGQAMGYSTGKSILLVVAIMIMAGGLIAWRLSKKGS
jgi:hypothetical protein